jgi:diguanylate cyclase (GGDEF)-like protein
MRAQAREAERRSGELEEMQYAFAAIARVAREVALGTEARELVCTAALASLDATVATVGEPGEEGFKITGSAGVPLDRAEIRNVEPLASLRAYDTGERVFIPDARQSALVSAAITQATGIVSVVFEPILRDGSSVGVLAVGWRTPRDSVDAKTDAILRVLATEAGAAIERADLLAQLDGLARSDPLTGLPNRRTWDETITSALADGTILCVAMIDLDHFKHFNDEHGHAAGDRLLKSCAAMWRDHLRAGDTLARVGGEEFAVLLPRCTISDASDVLERLRCATPSEATASVGVAEIQPGEDAASILARADAALYEAKTAGRNQLLTAA